MTAARRLRLRLLIYRRAYRRKFGRYPVIGCHLVWPGCMRQLRATPPDTKH
jgi:hypothetical protein